MPTVAEVGLVFFLKQHLEKGHVVHFKPNLRMRMHKNVQVRCQTPLVNND